MTKHDKTHWTCFVSLINILLILQIPAFIITKVSVVKQISILYV